MSIELAKSALKSDLEFHQRKYYDFYIYSIHEENGIIYINYSNEWYSYNISSNSLSYDGLVEPDYGYYPD